MRVREENCATYRPSNHAGLLGRYISEQTALSAEAATAIIFITYAHLGLGRVRAESKSPVMVGLMLNLDREDRLL